MRAAALLRHLKGQLIDVTGVQIETFTNTAASAEAYWQLSKACGVHVYQEHDGWHADLEFKDLPKGIPVLIGMPVPVATRAEAIESVVGMMSICAQRDAVPPPDPETGLRWFRFDQHEVPIHPKLLADYTLQAQTLLTDPADIYADLEDIRMEITGGGPVTSRNWEAAAFESRYAALKICHVAMANGMRQFSLDQNAAPRPDVDQAAPSMH
jgi:hypothetical protein